MKKKRMLGRVIDGEKCGEKKVEECLTFFFGSSAENGVWMEECQEMEGVRNVLKVSELNNRV